MASVVAHSEVFLLFVMVEGPAETTAAARVVMRHTRGAVVVLMLLLLRLIMVGMAHFMCLREEKGKVLLAGKM